MILGSNLQLCFMNHQSSDIELPTNDGKVITK